MYTQTNWLKTLKRTPSPFDVYTTGTPTNGQGARDLVEKSKHSVKLTWLKLKR